MKLIVCKGYRILWCKKITSLTVGSEYVVIGPMVLVLVLVLRPIFSVLVLVLALVLNLVVLLTSLSMFKKSLCSRSNGSKLSCKT